MIRHIDGAYVAAQVRLIRQVHKGAILIVEGQTDARVFDEFIDKAECEIEIGFGKPNVIDALDRLEDEGFAGVLAIVDADFDRLTQKTYNLDSLYFTDSHDLDLTIFCSSALEKYVSEFSDKNLYARVFNGNIVALRDKIVTAALPLARCRFVSEFFGYDLIFKDLQHDDFIDVNNLSENINALIATLIERSRTNCTEAKLRMHVANEAAKLYDPYQLANGHDVAAVLGLALRKLIGTRRDVHTWASEIEAGLRLAFSWEEFTQTKMFGLLRAWESENKQYKLISEKS
jgi:hypothetical protein